MRTSILVLLLVCVGVIASATALASPQFGATFQMTYSSTAPNTPSGLNGVMTWSDPGEPGAKPKEIQRIKLDFHPGTRLDTSALPACKASDTKVRRLGPAACPRPTRLGSVRTESVISTGARFNAKVFLFNARRQIIVLVTIGGRVITEFRDDVRSGSVTINLAIPQGVSLTRLQVDIPRHVRKRGSRKRVYMRTPPSCPATGLWTTGATFTYRDASTQRLTATTPCKAS